LSSSTLRTFANSFLDSPSDMERFYTLALFLSTLADMAEP
jgi:hypothetical protein